LEPYVTGFYPVALIHLCQGLALVDQLRQGLDVGAALEQHLLWLRERAADAPGNFGHLALLLQAERLAVEGQWLEALELYESALRDAIAHQRPWHAAFICERAGRCYLTAGLEQAGQRLLEQAYQRYGSWGADRKAAALIEEFPFLRACIDTSREQAERLQASQDLGRLRTLPELIQATATLIAQLSGATDVHIVVLDGQGQWQLKGGLSPDGVLPSLRLEEAERQGLLPAAALRLSLQRLQPLVFHDALLDPRVSGDPFVAPLACCSLLVVPVLVQLRPVAMVIGVHRHQRGVFSAALAQSVGLLCGQLGVALENLQIQRSLEEQVEERGRALEQAYLREAHDKERRRQLLEQKLKTSLTAAAVVHEIQQPLAAILLKCRLVGQDLAARRDGEALAHLKQHLLSLSGDAEQMAATMERMRMLLRNVETTHSRIDLASTLDSVLLYLRSEIKAHHVQVGHGGLEQPCMIQGDGAQLQTAVVNLIRNAIQAMEAQSASSRQLVVELERTPGQLRVVVADSGPGFPEDVANGGSWEVPRSTKSTGMGLGLFLAQTAAANHHGDLLIGRSSQLGGAEVVIILPLSPAGHGAMA
jgi:signal transduction histidine kinase